MYFNEFKCHYLLYCLSKKNKLNVDIIILYYDIIIDVAKYFMFVAIENMRTLY